MSASSEDDSVDLNESSTESNSQPDGENDSHEAADDNSSTEDMSEGENSDEEAKQNENIDESDMSSDDGDNNDEIDEVKGSEHDGEKNETKTIEDKIREEITNRIKNHVGKQLYVRFGARLPEDENAFQKQAKALSPLITKVIRPRQKSARFCLVDFETQENRDAAYAKLRAAINKKEPSLKGIIVSIPRTENKEFVESLIERKLKARERKIAKNRKKNAIKKSKQQNGKSFTCTVLVRNLPGNVSTAEIKKIFPKAVDIQMKLLQKNKTSLATVTLPTSKDAREAVNQNLSLGGTRLKVTFHGGKVKLKKEQRDNDEDSAKEEQSINVIKPKTKIRKVLGP